MLRICSLLITIVAAAIPTPGFAEIDFAHDVVPILKAHCVECHGGKKAKGGFSLNTRALFLENDAAVPGDKDSLFLMLINESDKELQMPPEGKPRVTAAELKILRQWVEDDMPWEPGFTFGERNWEPPLSPRIVELPPAHGNRNHPIDRILDAELVQRGLQPPALISDEAFLRRASLDAIGLLPTPEQLKVFTAERDVDKRTLFIDSILGDDVAYADHWLSTWNDLLRNDYTGTGFITNGRSQITTWLYDALRQNKPYDVMVRELISPPTPASAGFINGIKWRGEVNSSQTLEIQFAQNVSQVFLGINMKCASCHDSFIDRWTLEEAYNLAAIFSDRPLEINRCDKPTGVMATARWMFPELGQVDPEASKTDRLQQLASLMTDPNNGRFSRTLVNRIWHRLMGRGIVHPVDAMGTQPWSEDLLDYLAVRFVEDGYDLRKLIRLIMTSQAYQSQSEILAREPGEDYFYRGPIVRRMTAEQLMDSIWQITASHPGTADAVVDRTPRNRSSAEPAASLTMPEVSAHWIWHEGEIGTRSQIRYRLQLDQAPTGVRVLATCDNAFVLKINGQTVASSKDWMKPVHQDVTAAFQAGDNLIEFDAEMFGGAAGLIAQFAIQEPGKELQLLTTDAEWEARPPGGEWNTAKVLHAHGEGPWGKVMNPQIPVSSGGPTPPIRAALVKNDFLMRSLGRPHRDQVVTTRPSELTTLQAIDLANGDIMAGYLRSGAEQLKNREDLPTWIYEFAFSRSPTAGETRVLREVLEEPSDAVGVEDMLWLIFMQPEFQMIR
jgi:hypothetical protein